MRSGGSGIRSVAAVFTCGSTIQHRSAKRKSLQAEPPASPEGTRIEATLYRSSSHLHAPVVAVVENTYAVGDTVLVPAERASSANYRKQTRREMWAWTS